MIRKVYDHYKEIILYTCITTVVGIAVGVVDAVFGRVLLAITDFRNENIVKLIPFLPAAGIDKI